MLSSFSICFAASSAFFVWNVLLPVQIGHVPLFWHVLSIRFALLVRLFFIAHFLNKLT